MGGRGANSGAGKGNAEEKFIYERDPSLKEWSDAEQKRRADITKWVEDKIRVGGWEEYYQENFVEDVETVVMPATSWYREEEVTVSKMNIVYAHNWDENDRSVKAGKAVTGSTYYIVQDENGAIEEDYRAYKTKADAVHAMNLYVDRENKRRAWLDVHRPRK